MKFGKLNTPEGIDFAIPPDGPITNKLAEGTSFKLYSGGTQFGRPEWVGNWFPEKTKQADFLIHYSKLFNTIELNATHYRIFPLNTVEGWSKKVGEDFRFCPKWPQSITHRRRFKNAQDITDDFLASISGLGQNLGPCFIQLPPNYTTQKADALFHYLHDLPRDFKVTVEFRHPSWFEKNAAMFYNELHVLNVGACMSDTAGRRDALHLQLSAPFVLLRFGGYELHTSDYARMTDWTERFVQWKSKGIEEIHLLMHQPDSLKTPETLAWWNTQLNERFGLKLPIPKPIVKQCSLF